MLGSYKTAALVLRNRKYQEADCLLTLLTEKKGKIGAIAKGARKPNSHLRGGVQTFTYNDMLLYRGRNLDTVTQSQCLEAFIPLQENIAAISAAGYWSELLDALIPEGGGDADIFNLALAGFHILALDLSSLVLRSLEIKLLFLLGYNPVLGECVSCGSSLGPNKMQFFSVAQGGMLCPRCNSEKRANFSQEAASVWQQLLRMELSKISRLRVTPSCLRLLSAVTEEFLMQQLSYPLKSRALLKELLENERA